MLGGMEQRSELGEFLRSRRARLRPEDVGLPDYGGRRRVPGLRREELAQLAGVSAGYYTRLEQGQSTNASEAVLDAVARVLRLDETEHAHLRSLARQKAASSSWTRTRASFTPTGGPRRATRSRTSA
jgi:transcriptional regulator with XRE-family HTH domain